MADTESQPFGAPVQAEAPWPAPGRAWYTISLIALVTLLSNIDRSVINLLVEPIRKDLDLDDVQMSLIVGMAFSLLYLVTGLPMSRVSDVKSRRWILGISLAIWSAGTVACGFVRSFAGLFAARGLVGAAEAVPGPASMSMMADLVPRNRLPRAFAIYQLGIGFGQSGALALGGFLLWWYASMGEISLGGATFQPWQMVFITCGLPGILIAALWLITVREPERRNRVHKGAMPLREVLRYLADHKAVYLPMFFAIAVSSIETQGSSVWRAPMFERSYGWGPEVIGPLFGATALVTLPFSLICGTWFAEKLIKRGDAKAILRVSIISNIASMPFQVAAPLMPDPWSSFVILVISIIIFGMSAPAVNAAIQFVTPNDMRAQVSALYLLTISVVGSWFGPLFVALTTEYIFQDKSQLYLAMSGFALILSPISLVLMWIAMGAFGRVMQAREAAGL